jgi:peptidoglycan/xylan/chitin deacetylase (PgdA/CDA1 family)
MNDVVAVGQEQAELLALPPARVSLLFSRHSLGDRERRLRLGMQLALRVQKLMPATDRKGAEVHWHRHIGDWPWPEVTDIFVDGYDADRADWVVAEGGRVQPDAVTLIQEAIEKKIPKLAGYLKH